MLGREKRSVEIKKKKLEQYPWQSKKKLRYKV